MTALRRAALLIAILAALLAAPPAAFAVQPNQLVNGAAAPISGSTLTPFTLSVRYVSYAGNPATSVTASVAGLSLPMVLIGGTTIDGTWSRTTFLPAPNWPVTTWTVTFSAIVTKGPQPSIPGPTLSVSAPAPTPAPPSATPADSMSIVPSADPTNPPDLVPSSPAPGANPGAPAPSASASTGGSGPSAGSSGSVASGGTPSGSRVGSAGSGSTPAAPASTAGPANPSDGVAGATAGPSDGEGRALPDPREPVGGGVVWTILLVGMVGVAGVAVLGSVWVFLGRDRSRDAEPLTAPEPARAPAAGGASPVLGRRALRRAQLAPTDDPILTALGLGGADPPDKTPAGRSRRAAPRRVSTGSGEPPLRRARPPRDTDW